MWLGRMGFGSALLAAALLGGALLGGCGMLPTRTACRDCDVLLIMIDTLRADHLGVYGYPRDTSPYLDHFARRHVQFARARSQASCTFPSVNSLFTARAPGLFYDPATRPGIPPEMPTLAEHLAARGYRTAAVSASPIVRKTPSRFNPRGGFGAGFETFDEHCQWMPATCVSDRALDVLRAPADGPRFTYLHYMDPHDPYRARATVRGMFAGVYDGPHDFIGKGDPNPIQGMIRDGTVDEVISAADLQYLKDRYDEEIRVVDFEIGRLFEHLETPDADGRRAIDRTLVIVTSDHGEAFLEHGTIKHCYGVRDEETRVPLILAMPSLVRAPQTIEPYVQVADIMPTVLDALGFGDAVPSASIGTSLLPLLRDPEQAAASVRYAFSAMSVHRSVSDAQHTLLYDLSRQHYTLIDHRRAVPAAIAPDEARRPYRRLEGAMAHWLAVNDEEGASAATERADEIEEELRALGYLG